jgi:uncharacterized protein (TIGR03067 family)
MKKLCVVLAACLLVAADDEKDVKGVKEKLQGTWTPTAAERKGQKLPLENHSLVIEGETLVIKQDGKQMFKGKFKLDPSKKPATIDLEIAEGPEDYKGKVSQGIYVLDGDTLKWCNSEPGVADRPKEFATSDKANHMLLVFKREKK